MTYYDIIVGEGDSEVDSVISLAAKINKLILEGYIPVGGPSRLEGSLHNVWFQAVYKEVCK